MRNIEKKMWLESPTLITYKGILDVKSIKMSKEESYIVFVDNVAIKKTPRKRKLSWDKNGKPYFKLDNNRIFMGYLLGVEQKD